MEQRGARRGSKAVQEAAESEEEKAEESEEEEVAPRRRSVSVIYLLLISLLANVPQPQGNARNSIAAFLQDQSDSD